MLLLIIGYRAVHYPSMVMASVSRLTSDSRLEFLVSVSSAFSMIEVHVFLSATHGIIRWDTTLPVDITYYRC